MRNGGRQIKLGMFLRPAGHHLAAWRHAGSQADAGVNFRHFVEIAQTAERGLFDMLFSADSATANAVFKDNGLRRMSYVAWIEPFTLLSALASVTSHIGLACTASTTYEEPFSLARKFASLDLVSGGRAAWNLVTTGNHTAAQNFSRSAHPQKGDRYRRAREFADVVLGLWDSWEDDAFIRDRDSGIFFDPAKMHRLGHEGEHFNVMGPLNVARSPQGRPVMVQAGASEEGMELAAECGEVVFAAAPTLGDAQAFYSNVKGRLARYGRAPEDLKIMPGFFLTVARTRSEAKEKHDHLQSLLHPEVGLALLEQRTGLDLSGLDVDGPFPELPPGEAVSSRATLIREMAMKDHLTIRQTWERIAGGRGHYDFHGSAEDVADVMEEWFLKGGADGFNIMPPVMPGGLDDFVDLVVPELQRRGLYRTRYDGVTLRDHLGLRRPPNRYAVQREAT